MTPVAAARAWKSFDVGRCDAGNLTAADRACYGLPVISAKGLAATLHSVAPVDSVLQESRSQDRVIPHGVGTATCLHSCIPRCAPPTHRPSHRRHVRALAFRIRWTGDHSMNIRNASPNLLNEDLAPATPCQ